MSLPIALAFWPIGELRSQVESPRLAHAGAGEASLQACACAQSITLEDVDGDILSLTSNRFFLAPFVFISGNHLEFYRT